MALACAGVSRNLVSNRFDWPRLHREWPGCVKVYRRAVDSARLSRLNALAVYAFDFAIAWLPGQTCVRSDVDVLAAQNSPSRSTTAPHIRSPPNSPPIGRSVCAASCSSFLSSKAFGSPEHDLG